jgi:hypothetical protein
VESCIVADKLTFFSKIERMITKHMVWEFHSWYSCCWTPSNRSQKKSYFKKLWEISQIYIWKWKTRNYRKFKIEGHLNVICHPLQKKSINYLSWIFLEKNSKQKDYSKLKTKKWKPSFCGWIKFSKLKCVIIRTRK